MNAYTHYLIQAMMHECARGPNHIWSYTCVLTSTLLYSRSHVLHGTMCSQKHRLFHCNAWHSYVHECARGPNHIWSYTRVLTSTCCVLCYNEIICAFDCTWSHVYTWDQLYNKQCLNAYVFTILYKLWCMNAHVVPDHIWSYTRVLTSTCCVRCVTMK